MLRGNNSRILKIKNAKLSRYHFYMNFNIWGDFQICISVLLRTFLLCIEHTFIYSSSLYYFQKVKQQKNNDT